MLSTTSLPAGRTNAPGMSVRGPRRGGDECAWHLSAADAVGAGASLERGIGWLLAGRGDTEREVLSFVARTHQGQFYKGTHLPYLCHLIDVATLVATDSIRTEALWVALLHDVQEDHPEAWRSFVATGGRPWLTDEVKGAVAVLSRAPGANRDEYLSGIHAFGPLAEAVKAADVASNGVQLAHLMGPREPAWSAGESRDRLMKWGRAYIEDWKGWNDWPLPAEVLGRPSRTRRVGNAVYARMTAICGSIS